MPESIHEYLNDIKIQQYKTDIGFKTLMEGVNDNIYVIPKYQRKYKWSRERLEALVQSLICDFPIPPIYTYRNKKNQLEILDGQQRIFSLFFYYIGAYVDSKKNSAVDYQKLDVTGKSFKEALENAYILSPLETKMILENDEEIDISYANLPAEVKRMVDYVSITVVEIRWVNQEKKAETIQQIFKNLNKGGVNLEPQEVRDGVYDCKFYDMLHDINDNNSAWRRLWGKESANGKDMEALLTLCAFRKHVSFDGKQFQIENYTGRRTNFLDHFSEYVFRIEEQKIIEEYKNSIEEFIGQMQVGKVMNQKVTLLTSVYIVCEKCNIKDVITDDVLDKIKFSESYKNNTDQGTFAKGKMTERWRVFMKFCRSVLYNAKKILIQGSMKYTHTILIGENASGKSELLREYVGELLSKDENVYYIDSVNRYFDISKVSTPYSDIEKSSSKSVVKTRMEREYFNLKDTFSLFGTLNDQIELIYLAYEQKLQEMLKRFLGFSFEMKGIKEKEVRFDSESEGVLSSGIQALVRIFLELLYLNDMKKNHVHVIIDEIDEFLSPSNSGKILDFLITQFPNLDFLVSTHSIDLVKSAKRSNIMILYNADIEVIDADDFCDEYDVTALFERVFPSDISRKDTIEDKLRILLNNRVSGAWTEDNKEELSKLEKGCLTNSQKLLIQQIKEW